MTQPFFQPVGNEPAFRDLVNNTQSEKLIEPAVSLKITGGQPSGPGDLEMFFEKQFPSNIYRINGYNSIRNPKRR